MSRRLLSLNYAGLWAIALAAGPFSLVQAETVVQSVTTISQARLALPAARISDNVIQQDYQVFQSMQGRIKALNDAGRLVRDYSLAKAQCWLDVSFHEYTRNDRSAFPQAALTESEKLVMAMESQDSVISADTPLVNHAALVRPDLWAKAKNLELHPGFTCAQHKIACAQVELVHAGNEQNQQQWRHAKPYIQIAEDLLYEADQLVASCPNTATVVTKTIVAPPTPVASVQLFWQTQAQFRFDRSEPADMLPASVQQIKQMLQRLQDRKMAIKAVRLTGYADRLSGLGSSYNQQLSERRVQTVRQLLIEQGIAANLIETIARGSQDQLESCAGQFESKEALQACLLPNRRVEIQIEAVPISTP